jgi:hypothetical protein
MIECGRLESDSVPLLSRLCEWQMRCAPRSLRSQGQRPALPSSWQRAPSRSHVCKLKWNAQSSGTASHADHLFMSPIYKRTSPISHNVSRCSGIRLFHKLRSCPHRRHGCSPDTARIRDNPETMPLRPPANDSTLSSCFPTRVHNLS